MTNEQIAAILAALKVDCQISTTAYDSRLKQIIESSYISIKNEGASLDVENLLDAQLVVMYASWIWRRRETGEGMPRMLRLALNNRILGEKANG